MFIIGAIIGGAVAVGTVYSLFWRSEEEIINNTPSNGESIGISPIAFIIILLFMGMCGLAMFSGSE